MNALPMWAHGYCYRWQLDVLLMHLVGDTAIGIAYIVIPLTIRLFQLYLRDVVKPARGEAGTVTVLEALNFVRFKVSEPTLDRVLAAMVVFILFCGLTHFANDAEVFWPIYRLTGLLKLATAIVSLRAAWLMAPSVARVAQAWWSGEPEENDATAPT